MLSSALVQTTECSVTGIAEDVQYPSPSTLNIEILER